MADDIKSVYDAARFRRELDELKARQGAPVTGMRGPERMPAPTSR